MAYYGITQNLKYVTVIYIPIMTTGLTSGSDEESEEANFNFTAAIPSFLCPISTFKTADNGKKTYTSLRERSISDRS